MKIVLGLVSPTAGTTQIFGRDSREVESREDVGFLPENPYFYKYLTGEETLHFYGKLCGLSGAKLRERTEELLEARRPGKRARPPPGRLLEGHAPAHRPRPGHDPGAAPARAR